MLNRWARLMFTGVTVGLASCATTTHEEAKIQAEQRWNQVRGRVRHQLARQQCEGGLFEEAVGTLTEALALDPAQPDAYVMLAQANLELGRHASAERALDMARQAGLVSPDLIYMQGVILEQREDLEAALEFYGKARALDPSNVDYLVAEAECLVARGRAPEALALLDNHARRLEDRGTSSTLAAHIAVLLGDVDGAAAWFREVAAPVGEVALAAEELGLLLARAGRHEEALALLEPLLDQDRGPQVGGAARRALATCYLVRGDPTAAKRVLAEYVTGHPADAPAQLLLAKAAIAAGDLLTALVAIDAAERHAPNRPEVKFVRAVVQWRRGDLVGAAAALRSVLTLTPDDVDAHCLMAEVLAAQHEKEAARRHFSRALEIDPQSAWAAAGLESPG